MQFELDVSSSEPVYLQIVSQVELAVARGKLEPGDQLPTVRELALQLVINPNTVQKAYTTLIGEGVIHSRKGLGVFVSDINPTLSRKERTRRIVAASDSLLAEAIHLGYSPEEIQQIIAERLCQFQRDDKGGTDE